LKDRRENIKGLTGIAGWIFLVWGVIVAGKGVLDAFVLKPDSEFVTLRQWVFRWAPFEIVYGLACVLAGIACFEYSKRMKN